jgi:hypothetical protein
MLFQNISVIYSHFFRFPPLDATEVLFAIHNKMQHLELELELELGAGSGVV